MRKFIATAAVVLGAIPLAGAAAGTVAAYSPWNCGSVTHSCPAAAGSALLSSTVLGCGMKVAIECSPTALDPEFGTVPSSKVSAFQTREIAGAVADAECGEQLRSVEAESTRTHLRTISPESYAQLYP